MCFTALIIACEQKNIDMAKLLIDNFKDQIDINAQGMGGRSALHWTFRNKDIDLAKLLIDNFKDQIDINDQDKYGKNALYFARKIRKFEIATLLVGNFKYSINIMTLDEYYKPIYEYFASNNQSDFIKLFVSLLLVVINQKIHMTTPLHIAYLLNQDGGEKVLDYLLSIPELVELDGLQGDKFQTLPHQVTPLPIDYIYSRDEYFDDHAYDEYYYDRYDRYDRYYDYAYDYIYDGHDDHYIYDNSS